MYGRTSRLYPSRGAELDAGADPPAGPAAVAPLLVNGGPGPGRPADLLLPYPVLLLPAGRAPSGGHPAGRRSGAAGAVPGPEGLPLGRAVLSGGRRRRRPHPPPPGGGPGHRGGPDGRDLPPAAADRRLSGVPGPRPAAGGGVPSSGPEVADSLEVDPRLLRRPAGVGSAAGAPPRLRVDARHHHVGAPAGGKGVPRPLPLPHGPVFPPLGRRRGGEGGPAESRHQHTASPAAIKAGGLSACCKAAGEGVPSFRSRRQR